MPSLIGRILINKQLPGKKQLLQEAKQGIKAFIKNPKKAIKEGMHRDKVANLAYKAHTGKGRWKTTGMLAKTAGAGAYKGGAKDWIVNAGGYAGSTAGGAGGLPGALAGDWAGAVGTRKILDRTEARIAAGKIKKNPNFLKLDKGKQKQIIDKRKQGFRKSIGKGYTKEIKSDTLGWGIGNSAAIGLDKLGVKVPFKGGAVATASLTPVKKGYRVAKRVSKDKRMPRLEAMGTGVRKGILATNRNLVKRNNYKKGIKKGFDREKKMVASVNRQLQTLPPLPVGVNFRRIHLLSDFSGRYSR